MLTVEINGKKIGRSHPCYIVFEAGPTHGGIEGAKELIRHAADANADAIKFQIIDADRLVADKKQLFEFDILIDKKTCERKTVSKPLCNLLKERELTSSEWKEIKLLSDELGLAFFATIAFPEEIEFVQSIGCHSIKIASSDVNHIPLIRLAAQTNLSIQLDTGNATIGEIEKAVEIITAEGNEKIIIHQCPSGYPAHIQSINLNMITTLSNMFEFPIAYSDHSPGWDMDIVALTLGASLLEKTVTRDKLTPSVEHVMSLEPNEMNAFVGMIRDVESAMGNGRRSLSEKQLMSRQKVRRGLYIKEDATAGEIIKDIKTEFRRPGNGIGPEMFDLISQYKIRCDLKAGEFIDWIHLEK